MSLIKSFSGLFRPQASTPGPLDDFWYSPTPYINRPGNRITPTKAMQVTAVYACVRVLSETMGSLPVYLYEHLGDESKEWATEHALFDLLRYQPNHYQTPFDFFEDLVISCCLRGFFYAQIVINRLGQIEELLPLHPDRVTIEWLGPRRWRYRYLDDFGQTFLFKPEELFRVVLHKEADGVTPVSPIRANCDSVGLTESAERYAATYFENSATPGGSLEADGKLSPESKKEIRESWNRSYRGPDNAGKIAVLDQGLKFKQITINNRDSQLLELRQFQLTDIARIFRVPPHLIQDLSRSTFSNIEHQSLDFVTYTARPWARRIEQAISRDLLLQNERKKYFALFGLDDLLALDAAARASLNASGIQNSYMTINEARRAMNLNPLPEGDELMITSNLRKMSDPPPGSGAGDRRQNGQQPDQGQQSTNKGTPEE